MTCAELCKSIAGLEGGHDMHDDDEDNTCSNVGSSSSTLESIYIGDDSCIGDYSCLMLGQFADKIEVESNLCTNDSECYSCKRYDNNAVVDEASDCE